MAILKIARMGHPVLRRRADEVKDPAAPEIRRLAEDMLETMRDAPGTGLAAPQVHVPLRVVIFEVAETRAQREKSEAVPLTVMVNPVIEPLGEARSLGWEGCLSVPGLAGMVPRLERIRYRFQTLEGETVEREAEGFHARVVQHECDHLDGVLYPQRMDDLSLLVFAEELKHGAPTPKGAAPAEEEAA